MGVYKDLSDVELLGLISKFDSKALEEMYNRYATVLYTLIKKISLDEQTAEGIFIEVFAIIWKKSDCFDYRAGNVYAWLINLARNRAIDSLKRSREKEGHLGFYDAEYEEKFVMPLISPSIKKFDIHHAQKLKMKIESGLSQLSDAQKYVIHLAFYEGYTIQEISQRLNIPISTVGNKINVALNNLRTNIFPLGMNNIQI